MMTQDELDAFINEILEAITPKSEDQSIIKNNKHIGVA